jgi:hypothetical protein
MDIPTSVENIPALSTSVASGDSNVENAMITTSHSDRHDSATSQARGNRMMPIGLEKIADSIQENKFIVSPSSLNAQLAPSVPEQKPAQHTTPSTSTVATTANSEIMSPAGGPEASTSTDESGPSVVRGFQIGHISISARSTTNLNLDPPPKNEVSTRTLYDVSESSETAIETDSEDDVNESAIEEGNSDEWEDVEPEKSPNVTEHLPLFLLVESNLNLTSRRSLLTTALHQGDRASALQNEASRSSPAIRRSRTTTTLNGPSISNSPHEDKGLMMREPASRPKPIIMRTSDVHPPAMSPKTCRRNMLTSELTGSLRQNLLWERQQKNATTNAVAKRAQSAVNLPALRRAITTGDVTGLNTNEQQAQIRSTTFRDDNKPDSSYKEFFDGSDYHHAGW